MTPEDYFRLGAEAMRSEIAVRAMVEGKPWAALVGPWALSLPLPRFQLPEQQIIGGEKK